MPAKKRNNVNDEYIKKLVKTAQTTSSPEEREAAMIEILNIFEPLRKKLASDFASKGMSYDDVAQHVNLRIIEAICDYDETKSKSPIQHITARARNGAWNYYRKEKKYFRENRKEVSIEQIADLIHSDDGYDNGIEADVMYMLDHEENSIEEDVLIHKILLDKYFDELTDKQKDIIRKVFYEDMTQQEIADELNVNQSSISRVTKRGVERLRMYLNPSDEHYDKS